MMQRVVELEANRINPANADREMEFSIDCAFRFQYPTTINSRDRSGWA